MRTCWRVIVLRSLLLTILIAIFTQMVNAYFVETFVGGSRIEDAIVTLKITCVVAIPFSLFVFLLHARSDVAANHFRLLSRTDHLTGLLNRRAFIDALEDGSADQVAETDSRALLVIDLDHFKRVNDAYGHDAGDAVLHQIAALFHASLRDRDVVARLGGEEFAVALSRSTAQETWNVAQRLCQAVEQNVFEFEGQEIRLTISIGIVGFDADVNLEKIMRQADLLTYQSKKDGRNRISYIQKQFGMKFAA